MLLPPLTVAIFTADGSNLDRRRQQQSATVGAAAVQSILIAILFYVSDATEQEEPEGLQMTTRACMLLPMSHDVLIKGMMILVSLFNQVINIHLTSRSNITK